MSSENGFQGEETRQGCRRLMDLAIKVGCGSLLFAGGFCSLTNVMFFIQGEGVLEFLLGSIVAFVVALFFLWANRELDDVFRIGVFPSPVRAWLFGLLGVFTILGGAGCLRLMVLSEYWGWDIVLLFAVPGISFVLFGAFVLWRFARRK
jgi:hypothetical protein